MTLPKAKYSGDKIPPRWELWVGSQPLKRIRQENLKGKMDKCGVSIMGLSEVKPKGQGKIGSGKYTMFYSGGNRAE